MAGKISWIGYIPEPKTFETLPTLKKGILNPGDLFPELILDTEKMARLNMIYAKDYSLLSDTEILFQCWKKLDRQI